MKINKSKLKELIKEAYETYEDEDTGLSDEDLVALYKSVAEGIAYTVLDDLRNTVNNIQESFSGESVYKISGHDDAYKKIIVKRLVNLVSSDSVLRDLVEEVAGKVLQGY